MSGGVKLLLVAVGRRNLAICVIIYVITCYAAYNTLPRYLSRDIQPPLTSIFIRVPSSGRVSRKTIIAVGGGITSRRLRAVNESNLGEKFVFFTSLLPSFCKTASSQFSYAFYLAYDYTDRVFSNDRLYQAFVEVFWREIDQLCPDNVTAALHLVNCSHTGSPAWAQNDAMMDAYLDDVDYFYRINDDSEMLTSRWADMLVAALDGYDPPRVGVVGPKHTGGNVHILTYDFVHKTHVDIFGFYYPRSFANWFGDGWITRVYKPDRCTKLSKVRLKHTLGLGKRYRVNRSVGRLLEPTVRRDKLILSRSGIV